jgi:uncharacterized membrane protein
MNIISIIAMTFAGTVSFAVLDYLWLSKVMKAVYIAGYGRHINVVDGSIAINLLPGAIFYVFASLMIIYFAVKGQSTYAQVLLQGAMLGAFGYGMYNLTLAAVLPDYPWKMVLVDSGWGIVATAGVAAAMFFVQSLFA